MLVAVNVKQRIFFISNSTPSNYFHFHSFSFEATRFHRPAGTWQSEAPRGLIYKTQCRFHPKTLLTHKSQNLRTQEKIQIYKTVQRTPVRSLLVINTHLRVHCACVHSSSHPSTQCRPTNIQKWSMLNSS